MNTHLVEISQTNRQLRPSKAALTHTQQTIAVTAKANRRQLKRKGERPCVCNKIYKVNVANATQTHESQRILNIYTNQRKEDIWQSERVAPNQAECGGVAEQRAGYTNAKATAQRYSIKKIHIYKCRFARTTGQQTIQRQGQRFAAVEALQS